ncbi:hypothetical protein FRX31_032838 [Thalictrum thalictroides]|uniref:Uncharacterized protein n=1 Tax=Thalictrum thalictroides TaxID=46969 RepID=A0A7J6UZX6_THATH|nr:hypothetical protein FRX31_032838 [Thalictrum thalictroides]
MKTVVSKVAVVGSGISDVVCASFLARNGISVTILESGRGSDGRMSTRSECWVLHSTTEHVISQTGLQKLPSSILSNVAGELFQEFQRSEMKSASGIAARG